MILFSCKGENNVYHELNKKEIDNFIKKYLNPYDDYTKEIKSISCINYNNIYEYLINKQYILKIYL